MKNFLAEAYQASCSGSYVNGSCYNICQRSRKQDYFLQRAVRISWHLFWDLITGGRLFNKVSYFEAAGVTSPFTHCWSLAIETQFYLIYPLILLGIYKLVKSRGEGRAKRGLLFAGVTLLLALISVILMIVLFDPQQDASRVYYGTDTRAFSLLFGALLAILWEYRMVPRRLSASVNMVLGSVSFAVLLVMTIAINGSSNFWYRGGLIFWNNSDRIDGLCSIRTKDLA